MGSLLLALGVLIGAFGAHGLEGKIPDKAFNTFETGVRYHFYHALGLMLLGIIQKQYPQLNLRSSIFLLLLGILLFSFNCYFYALTGAKLYAMLVPIGGVSFAAAWGNLFWQLKKEQA